MGKTKARVAFYGFTGVLNGYVSAVQDLAQHFHVQCFEGAETDTSDRGVAAVIHEFNPHILVFHYPGNGLELCKLLKERIYFLPVVLTVYANDSSSLETLKEAGIAKWQVADLALTFDSFAKHVMLRFKQEHLDK